jgi:hypothetical protein
MARERVWRASIRGNTVILRHYPVLAPGEDLVDTPETITMTVAEWEQRHATYDCHPDGRPITPRPGVGAPRLEAPPESKPTDTRKEA